MRISLEALSDFLNPMVVKELRQELRMRAFVNFFIWPQVAMATVLLLRPFMARGNWQQNSGMVDSLFWMIVVIPLFVFLPRRASLSFAKEAEANAMELVHLTRVHALSMTIGKWCALAMQTTLFVVAALPYLSMRYFVSGVDILGSLTVVALLWLLSMLLSAFLMIGSAVGAKNKKPVPAFILVIVLMIIGSPIVGLIGSAVGSSSRLGWSEWLGILCIYPFVLLQFLITAAARAAPPHEDYGAISRACTLCVLSVGLLMSWLLAMPAFALTAFGLVGPALIAGLVTQPHVLLFRRIRARGELQALLTTGGWPGEVLFLLCASPLAVGVLALSGVLEPVGAAIFALFTLVALLVPRVYSALLPYAKRRLLFSYFLFHIVTIFLAMVLLAGNRGSLSPIITLISPLVALILALDKPVMELLVHLPTLLVLLVLSCLVLWADWRRLKRDMQARSYVPQVQE